RTDALERVRPQGSFVSADRVFLAELSLQGRFIEIPERLFLHREHEGRAGLASHLREVQKHMTPDDPGKLVLPHLRLAQELYAAVSRAGLPWRQRMCCRAQALRWSVRVSPAIAADLWYVTRQCLRPGRGRA